MAIHKCLKCICAPIAGPSQKKIERMREKEKPFQEFNQLCDVQTNDYTDFSGFIITNNSFSQFKDYYQRKRFSMTRAHTHTWMHAHKFFIFIIISNHFKIEKHKTHLF